MSEEKTDNGQRRTVGGGVLVWLCYGVRVKGSPDPLYRTDGWRDIESIYCATDETGWQQQDESRRGPRC